MAGTSRWLLVVCVLGLGPCTDTSAQHPNEKDPFLLNKPHKDTTTIVEGGLAGYSRSSCDDLKAGWGAMALLDLVRWQPFLLRFDLNYSYSHTIPGILPDASIESVGADLSVMVRAMSDPFQPYIGAGASWISSVEPTDEHPPVFIPGGYEGLDPGTPFAWDRGSGFGPHVRAGLNLRIASKARLFLDVKYLFMTARIKYTYTEWPGGRTYVKTEPYDLNTFHVSFGMTVGVSKSGS